MRILKFLASIVLAGTIGCSSASISPEDKALQEKAETIPLASSITVTELGQYKELGPISCKRDATLLSKGLPEDLCRSDMKIETARLGGDLAVIDARDTAKCDMNDHLCIYLHGRAYQKSSSQK